jgi:hypothetical protein
MTNADIRRLKYEIRLSKNRIVHVTEIIKKDEILLRERKERIKRNINEIAKLRRYIGETEKNLSKLKKGK